MQKMKKDVIVFSNTILQGGCGFWGTMSEVLEYCCYF